MRTWLNKIMLIGIAAIVFSACEKDEVRTILSTGSAPSLQSSVTSLVLLQANANNDAVKFTYTPATFGLMQQLRMYCKLQKEEPALQAHQLRK